MQGKLAWTFGITTVALFMTALDNLVVVTALPRIQKDLHASLSSLEWTVNAYTLTFAVLLLTGAALGDRFGRKRLFVIGMTIFTAASALAALSHGVDVLIVARALQGLGGAIVTPLTLTILAHEVPKEKRGAILGAWGGIAGLAVAIGPVVGGAVVEGASWQWIFWLNVPIGAALLPLAARFLGQGQPSSTRLDVPGLVLISSGLLGLVFGLVRGNAHGWTSGQVLGPILGGAVLVTIFAAWELRTPAPMLPLRLFTGRGFTATNIASFLFSAGMFGSIFLLAQFLQVAQHYSPLSAGLRTLPWTGMPMLVAPIAGPLSDRWGGRPLIITGLVLQATGLAWLALVTSAGRRYAEETLTELGVRPLFSVVVTAGDVTVGKPDPEGYLAAARRLGTAPAACVVFEDAPAGVAAAKAAGMYCVAVATTHPPEDLAGADQVVPDLTKVTWPLVTA